MLKPVYASWEGEYGLGSTGERGQGMKRIGNKKQHKIIGTNMILHVKVFENKQG